MNDFLLFLAELIELTPMFIQVVLSTIFVLFVMAVVYSIILSPIIGIFILFDKIYESKYGTEEERNKKKLLEEKSKEELRSLSGWKGHDGKNLFV